MAAHAMEHTRFHTFGAGEGASKHCQWDQSLVANLKYHVRSRNTGVTVPRGVDCTLIRIAAGPGIKVFIRTEGTAQHRLLIELIAASDTHRSLVALDWPGCQ